MTDLFRDSIWTFVGTVLALAAIVVAVAIYYGQKQRKRILVDAVGAVPLIRGGGAIDGLEIKFRGEALESAIISIFKIHNIGNTPIPAADYENPIEIKFEEGARVLSANVTSSDPENIPADITHTEDRLTIAPHLLNCGDSVTYRALLTGTNGSFKVMGRVAGVKLIERQKPVSLVKAVLTIVGGVMAFLGYFMSPKPNSVSFDTIRPEEVPYIISMSIGMLIFLFAATGELMDKVRAKLRRKLYIDARG